jgi:hypothetical protein
MKSSALIGAAVAPARALRNRGLRLPAWSVYGAKRAQRVATGRKWESLKNGSNKPIGNRWQPTATVSDGKEGVNGSSPLEGFRKFLLISSFHCREERRPRASASTERPRADEFFLDEAPYCGY